MLATGSLSCGSGTPTGSSSEAIAAPPQPIELPFGLDIVAGTEPIGRPAVFDEPALLYKGEPVPARKLQAAFWVTAQDPVGVVRAWVDQLDRLALDEVSVQPGYAAPAQWIQVTGATTFVPDVPPGDYADLQLWATSGDPVLLVSITKVTGDPRPPAVDDAAGDPPSPTARIEASARDGGDPLFTEQGDTVHLPNGSEDLMPTIPTFGGTGGSTSVIAAPDAAEAVSALLEEARAQSEDDEVTGPTQTEIDGVSIATGSFVIPTGGWSFHAVAVKAPDDPTATVYVTSSAD